MNKKSDSIAKEARRIVKWNKKQFSRELRRAKRQPLGKGCQYKKNGYDARLKTMA